MEWLTVATFNETGTGGAAASQAAGGRHQSRDLRRAKVAEALFFISRSCWDSPARSERKATRRPSISRTVARTDGVLRHAIICPECGSSRIEFPQFSRHFLWGGIAAVFAVLRCFQRKFFCKSCNYTWPTSVKLEPKTDVLGWPEKQHQHR